MSTAPPGSGQHGDKGAQNPPRPVVEVGDEELISIPKVLKKLGMEPPEGELGDTLEDKAAVLKWLKAQR